ncbi:amylo-alpha-1,6-glucosidase [uncultured Sunxiuqinia sp.]|uniref:amylo-alpha-1,6-glucosidase n=1 Tax=uncultured Sunxiuqinia sp. TaxID=1573825 RepID=UPI00261577CC|nr:amylo-alpha-1,6-glucosidase [uncultured Sunxiuqinia sp.]
MSYLKFDKSRLVNLEYSLSREVLRSNRTGSYVSTTISGCNTRKYHGLLVCPLDELDGDRHVLLSAFDETVVQRGAEFNLGIHKYGDDYYEPKGHKYIRDFVIDRIPKTTFRVGGVILHKERILVPEGQQVLTRYTLKEASSPTVLRFKPFLAFRSVHQLSKANLYANTKYQKVPNGIKMKLYEGYPFLHMQFSKTAEFVAVPDWYNNIEYLKEKNRGYDYQEDLFVPGYFEVPIEKGESIVFSASTSEVNANALKTRFTRELNKRHPRDTFIGSLVNAGQQFFVFKGQTADLVAGFPWYGYMPRQTFVALPGLTLDLEKTDLFEAVVDTQLKYLKDGLFPCVNGKKHPAYHCMDTPLWFFWALQQYANEVKNSNYIWEKYGQAMKQILDAYRNGTNFNIRMNHLGLIEGEAENMALTWMDSYVGGKPVVQRAGMPVEVNALWYNTICFALELAQAVGDKAFVKEWEALPKQIADSFIQEFWCEEHGYLADSVRGDKKDWSVRPNMVIAAALDYSPLDREKQKQILSVAKQQLLTPRGLRTLSPESNDYEGICAGSVAEREKTLHMGTVWPWLLQFFVEGYLKIHKRGGLPFVKKIIEGFEEEMTEHCIGTIPENYNGNPPHKGKGAISQAWSVSALIRAYKMALKFIE